MGWFIAKKRTTKSNVDFRPRVGMGWFKCWNQPVEDGEIFVPEWGWVGSQKMKKFLVAYVGNIFSSPLGVGLVPFEIDVMQTWFLFSSPLGDGLVQCKMCWNA